MKNGWQVKPLQSLCNDLKQDIVDGPFGSELQRKDYITEGVPVLKIQNIKPFAIELKKMDYVSPAKFQELKRHSYRSGDIVMTKLGSPLGVSAIVEGLDEGVIVADLVRIRAQHVNTKYLCYHLNSQRTNDFINSMQKGTTRPRVTLSVVRELPIAVPSPVEQQRIVAILDQAFDGIAKARANAKQNLQNARALLDSHLQAVFTQGGEGWVEHKKPMADLCELIVDCEHKTAPKQEEGIPSIRTPNIGKGKLLLDDVYRVSEETYREWTRRAEPLPGDLILAREAPAGNIAVIPENLKVCLGQRTVLIRPSRKVFEPEFLALMLLQPGMQQKLLAHSRGATVQHVNMKDIRALDVGAIPPLSVQRDIVSVVSNASQESQRLESLYQRKLAAFDELKKSLLHQAFSGAL